MPLAQIQAALAAVDRRDAGLALMAMQGAHVAYAPLVVGREGSGAFDKFVAALRGVISPRKKSAKNSDQGEVAMFKLLKAVAMKNSIAAKTIGRVKLKAPEALPHG
jgi:hypothetical protein